MLAIFALRLALGMIACLLLLPVSILNPRFYRTHFLTALALAGVALVWVRDSAGWPLLSLLSVAMVLAFVGSLVWGLEGAPGGRVFIVLTALSLAGGLIALELSTDEHPPFLPLLLGDVTSSAVLGSALTAMLLGHSYLISPSMSLTPL